MYKLLLSLYLLLLITDVFSQNNFYPTKDEILKIDSLVLARFKESECYDSTEKYELYHIYFYRFITESDSVKKQDFLDKTILSKIEKKYMAGDLLIPEIVPLQQQWLEKYCMEQDDPEKIRDSLINAGLIMDIEKYNKNIDTTQKILLPYQSFIVSGNNKIFRWWPLGIWISCNANNYYIPEYDIELLNILKKGAYKILIQIDYTFWDNFLAIDKTNELFLLTFNTNEKDPVKKISMKELITNYWQSYAMFDKKRNK